MNPTDLSVVHWRKSSHSDHEEGCVEVAATHWRKSRHSDHQQGCVEVADLRPAIAVRDSKDPDGPVLAFDVDEWRVFSRRVRRGER
ncbi:DUF397 domain-containing protein [Actinomadura kijaniata]|uniref:DUF397 domain-containing protein n=1 Tax=Actinomadura kijaniata TaxID=46161 RepID=UPI0008345063|nr:DUF397 domain-containing protein [Actinomadura kijaniata]